MTLNNRGRSHYSTILGVCNEHVVEVWAVLRDRDVNKVQVDCITFDIFTDTMVRLKKLNFELENKVSSTNPIPLPWTPTENPVVN